MPKPPRQSNSAADRPVALRMRPDLIVRPQNYGGQRYWVVKDPVALAYFHLRDEEHAILSMLDGRLGLNGLKRRFEQLFAPLQTTVEHLQAFLAELHRCGLVVSDAPNQGEAMLSRYVRQRRQEWLQAIGGILAIRFRGIDPEPFLDRLHATFRWAFSAWTAVAVAMLVVAAITLVGVQADVFASRLPTFRAFFSIHNVAWMALALALTKVMHELGHALACKHFGGECHELGFMLLVFTPCLYCDVSDAWMLSNKWRRVLISAAGLVVEITLAAICTFLWWFSEPGLFNSLCLNVMFVCSVSTLLFNGNPLLRYDGYYILADILEVPNLSQQSRTLVVRGLARVLLGMEVGLERSLPRDRRWLIASYGVASIVYRWMVLIAILWFCHKALSNHGLELAAEGVTLVVVAGMVMAPVWGIGRLLRNPSWQDRIRWPRAAASVGILLALMAAFFAIPLPYSITAPAVLQPDGGRRVYVSVAGTLSGSVAAGTVVSAGQTLATLDDVELAQQIESLEGQRDQQQLRLKNLEFRLAQDPTVAPLIPEAREALADIEARLRQRRQDQERLTLTAPVSGTVLPPPSRPAFAYQPGQLHAWSGTPLDAQNVGCHLPTGTLLCLVGDPARLEAILVVDQTDLAFVARGQKVRIRLAELPGKVIEGRVDEVARTNLEIIPRELAADRDVPTRVDDDGAARPLEACYQVRVSLDDHDMPLLTGSCGRARVFVAAQPLGRRLYRFLRATFRFAG